DMALEHGHRQKCGHIKLELPDYRQWRIKGAPLETVQGKLPVQGLRDPWGSGIHAVNELEILGGFANNVSSFVGALLKGFRWGFATFVVAVGAEYYLESLHEEKQHH
ncbi:NADH dehydrogenase [ubiquinone] 1 beta subcomplex subunit 3, partial [Heterocephalus glaber]